jgi:hypothetical protein
MSVIHLVLIDSLVKHGGMIINGGSWYQDKDSAPVLEDLINKLKINLIVVISDPKITVLLEEIIDD